MKILIIGAGILGHMHALFALKRGYQVALFERDKYPVGASVRNFGLITVGARKAGAELETAVRARGLWEEIADEYQQLTFRPNGSIVIAKDDNELSIMSQYPKAEDAKIRGWQLLDANEVREVNPSIQGSIAGGLLSTVDAAVEPETVLTELREILNSFSGFEFHPATEIVSMDQIGHSVICMSRTGDSFGGDYAIVATGADYSTLFPDRLASAPLMKTYLQMARLQAPGFDISTSVSNADSLRYYPGYQTSELEKLPEQHPVGKELKMQLLLQQRIDGSITIGDSHQYDEPFSHELREDAYDYLMAEIEAIFGKKFKIISRWSGVYSQHTQGEIVYRDQIDSRIQLITGPGGRGNTLSPAIAEQTISEVQNV